MGLIGDAPSQQKGGKEMSSPARRTFAIDFETYYDEGCSIVTLGSYGYMHHPAFHAYLVAIKEVVSDIRQKPFSYVGEPEDCPWAIFEGALLIAHNAGFEMAVVDRLQEQGIIPAGFRVTWACTADMSAYLNAPRSLKGAAEELLQVKADKSVRHDMCGVTWARAQARGWRARCLEYVAADADLCARLWRAFSSLWPEKERQISAMNRAMGRKGIFVAQKDLQKALQGVGGQLADNLDQIPWSDSAPIASRKAFNAACAEAGIAPPQTLDKNNPETQAWFQQHRQHKWVAAVTRHRSLNALLEKLNTLQKRIRPDGMAEVNNLLYCGAATGRFSGTSGFNIQNMHKGEVFGVDVRSLFIPRPGHKFIISDLAQIEARLILYLAGDEDQLRLIRRGVDIYESHAIQTMGYKPGAKTLKAAGECDPALKKLRDLAKARVLGLGYGCGAQRFRELAARLAGVELTEEEAARQVQLFRASNPKICYLWQLYDYRFKKHMGSDYRMKLPSGRRIIYRNVRPSVGEWCCTVQGREVKEYGGKLVENLVQATARDLFCEMLLAVDALPGVEVRLHVHDEIVAEVPEDKAQEIATSINAIMSTAPAWLPACPLAADTYISDFYTK